MPVQAEQSPEATDIAGFWIITEPAHEPYSAQNEDSPLLRDASRTLIKRTEVLVSSMESLTQSDETLPQEERKV